MSGNRLIRAIIVDIDGTVALKGDRDPYDFSRVLEDQPNEPVITAVAGMWLHGFHLLFVSGRMEQCRQHTALWLQRHHLIQDHTAGDGHGVIDTGNWMIPGWSLFMRADGDKRPDDVVKDEIYREQIVGRFTVTAVFDDRDKVVRMWRDTHKLTVFQVADGNF